MKTRLFYSSLFLWGMSLCLHAQDYMNIIDSMAASGATFDEINLAVDRAWEGKFQGKHSGRKQYERWKYYHATRLDANGRLTNSTKDTWDTYYANPYTQTEKAGYSFKGNWESKKKITFDHLPAGYSGGMGRVNCVAIDPENLNILYVGTPGGGLWRSADQGNSWNPMIDGMPRLGVSSVVIDPSSPTNNRTLYIMTGDGDGSDVATLGVYKSTDNGATWMSTGLGPSIKTGYKLIMHPAQNNTLYAATEAGVFKTTNGALSWTLQPLPGYLEWDRVTDLEFHPSNPEILYASTFKGGIYKTTNGGQSWIKLSGTVLPAEAEVYNCRAALGVSPANPDYVYVLYGATTGNYHFSGVYRSINQGASFTLQSDNPNILGGNPSGLDDLAQPMYDLCITVSPLDANEVHVGSINSWKSADGAVTWQLTSDWVEYRAGAGNYTHADFHALEWDADHNLYCGTDGGISKSADFAENWANLSQGLEITQFYRIGGKADNPDLILGGAQDNGSILMDNTSTMHQWFGADGFECMFSPELDKTYYGSYQYGGLVKTTNGGLSKFYITPKVNGVEKVGNWLTPFEMDPNNSNILYAGYNDLFKSMDGGLSWENISNGAILPSTNFTHIRVSRANPNYLYATKSLSLYSSKDGGFTWTEIDGQIPQNYGVLGFTIDPDDTNKIWAYNNFGVYKTTDGGTTWVLLTNTGLPAYWRNTLVFQEGSNDGIYLGTDVGVYYIDNNLSSWVNFSNGLVNVEIFELEINYASKKIRAATYGRGVWESDLYINCDDGVTIRVPAPAKNANKTVGTSYTIEAESYISTGGVFNDSPYGGSGYGAHINGTTINYVNTGDWVRYNLPVNFESGVYQVDYYISTPMSQAAIALAIDNNSPQITDAVPNNGQWESYQRLQSGTKITLRQGVNRTIALTGAGTQTWEWNLDRMVFTKVAEITVPVDSVQLNQNALTLESDSQVTLQATVYPSNATSKALTWSSNNTSIATVTEGTVVAHSPGTAVVVVSNESGSRTDSCLVHIVAAPYRINLEAENRASVSNAFTIYSSSAGMAVEAQSGQWGSYQLPTVYESGRYRLECSIGSAVDSARMELQTDNTSFPETISLNVPNLGAWDTFAWAATAGVVNLERGRNYNVFLRAKGSGGKLFNMDKFRLERVGDLDIPVKDLSIQGDSVLTLSPNSIVELRTLLAPSFTTHKNVQWSSSNANVVSIYEGPYTDATNGVVSVLVRATNLGMATITATTEDGNSSVQYTLKVAGDTSAVFDVVLSEEVVYLAPGDTYSLTANVLPESASNQEVVWMCEPATVATVNSSGTVTAVASGDATLTVATVEGGFSKTCVIHVLPANSLVTIEAEKRVSMPSAFNVISTSGGSAVEANSGQLGAYALPMGFASGEYQIEYFMGSAIDSAYIQFSDDWQDNLVRTRVPNTGAWGTFVKLKERNTVQLLSGRHSGLYLRAQGPDGKVLNMDKFRLLRIGEPNVPVTNLSIVGDSVYTIEAQHGQLLNVRIVPSYATNTTVTWTTSDSRVIQMPSDYYFDPVQGISMCMVNTVDTGMASVTATAANGAFSKTFLFHVIPLNIRVEGVILSDDDKELNLGNSYPLVASVRPKNANNPSVTWSSSNPAVATVTASGLVQALSPGEAVITVTTVDGGFTDSCTIRVPSIIEVSIEAEAFTATGGTLNDSQWGRPGFGVNSTGTNINYVNTNDWVRYPLTIAVAGKYELVYYISTPMVTSAIQFSVNGTAYYTDRVMSNNQWDTYQPMRSARYYEFYPGQYVVELKGVGTQIWEWNLDKFKLTRVDDICVSPVNLKSAYTELPGTYAGPMPGLVQEVPATPRREPVDSDSTPNRVACPFSFYPNPASEQLTFTFALEQNEQVSIRMVNVTGVAVATVLQNEAMAEGKYEMNYELNTLSPGVYLVQFTHGGTTDMHKLIIE